MTQVDLEVTQANLVAVAALLHDIGKFGQRADIYRLRESQYKTQEYHYTHAAYTAQILNDYFNLGEYGDDAAMHHAPTTDHQWIFAAADRIASAFERETFEEYNAQTQYEDFKTQRLWHLFDETKQFKIAPLSPTNIFSETAKPIDNEYNELWQLFENDLRIVSNKNENNSSVDLFAIDYLLKKYTSFIPSATTFKQGNFAAVKANIPLYDHARATAIFAVALKKLYDEGNTNILNYYRHHPSDPTQQDFVMIAGDFFGIQSFIFNHTTADKASKILRAKSAFVQILTRLIAFYVVRKLGLSYQSIISTSAGKFEILGINTPATHTTLASIQRELNDYFLKFYFGQTGVGISVIPCSLSDFVFENHYKEKLRPRVAQAVESTKYRKFDLGQTPSLLEYDDSITNQTLCPLCAIRKIAPKRDYCPECDKFIEIGKKLTTSRFLTISHTSGDIPVIGDLYISFSDEPTRRNNAIVIYDIANDEEFVGYAKWELQSFVAKDHHGAILTFEELAQKSCQGQEEGIKALMAYKADVDFMGRFIKESEVTRSFARFNFFSRMVDYFFGVYAPTLMKDHNLYTIFAGGDDIFILGAWDEVLEFSKRLREDFIRFCERQMSLSAGMILTKPNKPVNFIAHQTKEALKEAKSYKPDQINKEKNALTLFGETVSYDVYLHDMIPNFQGILEVAHLYPENFNTAFWYRLIEFCEMRANINKDIQNALWRSKLAYSFRRNILEKVKGANLEQTLANLAKLIDTHGNSLKMVIFEEIYKRRS